MVGGRRGRRGGEKSNTDTFPTGQTGALDSSTYGSGGLTQSADNDTGPSANDGITSNNKSAFSGKGEPGPTVVITIGGKVLTAVVDASDNRVTPAYTDALPDGSYPVKITFTDKAGNTKEVDAGTVVIDTQGGKNQPGNSDDPNANATGSKDTGVSATDFITQDNTLKFKGEVTSFTPNGDKVHLQVVKAATQTWIINASATVSIDAITSDSGVRTDDFVTNDDTLTYSGSVASFTNNGDLVKLELLDSNNHVVDFTYVTPTLSGTAPSAGTWSGPRGSQTNGAYTLCATIVDLVDNRVNTATGGQDTQAIVTDSSTINDGLTTTTAPKTQAQARVTLLRKMARSTSAAPPLASMQPKVPKCICKLSKLMAQSA